MELVGTSEIAELAGTSRSAVSNWVSRDPSFPQPVADLACGQIWAKTDIETWLSANRYLDGNRENTRVKLGVGNKYTHDFICKTFGGDAKSGTYLPQSKQTILCGCFTSTMNPEAPDVVLVGGGPRIIGKAEKLLAQGGAIPIFMKLGTNQWEYRGLYELQNISRETTDIEARAVAADRNDVIAALFFRRIGD